MGRRGANELARGTIRFGLMPGDWGGGWTDPGTRGRNVRYGPNSSGRRIARSPP